MQPPAQSEEEKLLAEKKRQFESEMKKAQEELKKQGRDVFVRSSEAVKPGN